jgi:hypothetical protein
LPLVVQLHQEIVFLASVGSNITLKWQHFGAGCGCTTGWWLSYGGTFVGLFADSLWTSPTFTAASEIQTFGEMSLGYDPSQSDMGSGSLLSTSQATMTGFALTGSSPPSASLSVLNSPASVVDRWPVVSTSATSLRYGGPGGTELILSTTSPSADDCPGVGTGTNPSGQGADCLYDTASGSVPQGKVFQIDGSASSSVCRANIGKLDGQTTTGIGTLALTSYFKLIWFRDAACAGASQIYDHGRVNLPVGWTELDHASYKLSSTRATCATGYPGVVQTC